MPRKNRDMPRKIQIGGVTHNLCVFRLVEINGETVLKRIAMDETAHLKNDPKLNRFVTGFLPTRVIDEMDDDI